MINIPIQKDKVAIVTVGYNRLGSMRRLLTSLNSAEYPKDGVPLVISIDASGNQELYEYVRSFEWQHGEKYVNIQEERLGLKRHIFQCFSLSMFFRGVIILEDDIFVSPYFYHYSLSTLNKYENEERVAAIALYKNEYDGFNYIPLQHICNGYDVLAIQSCCTWGELLNERMWNNFSTWMEHFDEDYSKYDMNNRIKEWKRAWSKYMYAYMLDTDTYFIFPCEPVTTNFNDAGGEHGGGDSVVQVSLLQGRRNYQLGDFEELEHYDIYWQNKSLSKWIGIQQEELTVDFSGSCSIYKGRYVLAPFKLPYKRVKGFKLVMRPWELNVKYQLEGDDLILYDRLCNEPVIPPVRSYTDVFLRYHFLRYVPHLRNVSAIVKYYWKLIITKLGL